MNKIKNILAITFAIILIYSCGTSNNGFIDDFDHEAQALIDNDTLVQFLKNHYYDLSSDSIKALTSEKVALHDEIQTMSITENEINYTLYYYVKDAGAPNLDKGNPTVMDSVFVNYEGKRIVNTDSISKPFEKNINVWFTLDRVIGGWTHGITNFKGGDNITSNGPITYENGGKGVLFIPSGLAYANNGTSSGILPNQCLVFHIELNDIVKDTDHDNDGVASIFEDPDKNDNPKDDDTDQDGLPNYIDSDDDGDGTLTVYEDANGDGNPMNDFNDPDNPSLPDYLNPVIK